MDANLKRETLSRKVHALTTENQEAFLALHNAFPDSRDGEYDRIFHTNELILHFLKSMATNGPVKYGSDDDSDVPREIAS